jgi:hypothetical protein
MTAPALHRICAHPTLICWAIGASVLNGIVLTTGSEDGRLIDIATDLVGWSLLILALVGSTGLGLYLGIFTCGPWVRAVCRRFNGAPFLTGDRVIILVGPLRGSAASVEDITKGQGGQDVIWLDLGPERGRRSDNLCEEYSLLKIPFSPTVDRP